MGKYRFLFIGVTALLFCIVTLSTVYGIYSGALVFTSSEFTQLTEQIENKQRELEVFTAELHSVDTSLALLKENTASPSALTSTEEIVRLQTQISTKQNEVNLAKAKSNDYAQLQNIKKRGSAAIELYKKNYPMLLDPNLDSLASQAQSKYATLQNELQALKSQLSVLQKDQAQSQQAEQNALSSKSMLESTQHGLKDKVLQIEKEIRGLETQREQEQHWTQKLQAYFSSEK